MTIFLIVAFYVPKTRSNWVLFAVWLLGSLVLMKAYGGILTSMLTVPKFLIPINSLADLASQDEVPWRIEKDTVLYNFFQV